MGGVQRKIKGGWCWDLIPLSKLQVPNLVFTPLVVGLIGMATTHDAVCQLARV